MDDVLKVLADALRAAVGVQAAAYALAAIGLNVHFGFTGLINFGHIAFMAIGAYTTAIVVDSGLSLWLAVPSGLLAAVVLGILLGIPTLRLRADYLAITTIAVGEIIRIMVRSSALEGLTGGVFGIQGFADDFFGLNPFGRGSYGVWDVRFNERSTWVIVVAWALVALCATLVWALMRAPFGRVLKAIREDEDAARALGKNVFAFKIRSLCLGGAIGALAGIVLAFEAQAVVPDRYLPQTTFFIWTAMILGGTGSILGPIAGSVIFWFIVQFTEGLLRLGVSNGAIPEWLLSSQQVASVRFMLVGGVLMALMIWRPQGIFGKREEVLIGAR
ncbi:branched-chain amino acid ABC transporter permease [Actinomarinicola tropica]|uniref:Branched-chain amino acid ABC transporter permease n=1 Tax=Actinomarinicola tropica TaxID=2789776 RepID=A0A5Q2RQN0_9ACTN|nr:branched-chain amino acid ABC transporter permease [Actinomarinicola tropica]QGG96447.1 branched-chain amino acid ABC transporter permease [Actinomarinicola tropica]